MEEQDLTIEQVAKIVQVNRKTVERWISSGALEAYDIGNDRKRIPPKKLEEFKQRRRVHPRKKQEENKKETEGELALAG